MEQYIIELNPASVEFHVKFLVLSLKKTVSLRKATPQRRISDRLFDCNSKTIIAVVMRTAVK